MIIHFRGTFDYLARVTASTFIIHFRGTFSAPHVLRRAPDHSRSWHLHLSLFRGTFNYLARATASTLFSHVCGTFIYLVHLTTSTLIIHFPVTYLARATASTLIMPVRGTFPEVPQPAGAWSFRRGLCVCRYIGFCSTVGPTVVFDPSVRKGGSASKDLFRMAHVYYLDVLFKRACQCVHRGSVLRWAHMA